MILVFLCLCLGYTYSSKINSRTKSHFFRTFGFEVGGEYNVFMENLKSPSILFGLLRRDEAIKVNNIYAQIAVVDCFNIKKEINLSNFYNVTDKMCNFSGKIDKKDVYTPLLVLCDEMGSSYDITLKFKNPKTYLDYRYVPLLKLKPIITFSFFLLLVLWVLNWTRNFTLKNLLHLFLTITFGVSFMYLLIYWLELVHYNKTDKSSSIVHFVLIFSVFHKFCLLFVMMLAANGWCIIFEKLEMKTFVISAVFSILAVIPDSIIENYDISNSIDEFMLILVGFVFFILYYKNMVQAIDQANSYVLAHLYLISQSGIDPETTPIYGKYRLFNTISKVMLIYFLFILFKGLISEIFLIPYWVGIFSYDLITFLLMSLAAWIFKLKKQLKKGYMLIDTDEQNITEFSLEELDGVSFDSEVLHKGTRWEEGMSLPPQPIIISKKPDLNENSDEINVKPGNENQNDDNENII